MKSNKTRKIIILIAFLMVVATTLGFTYAFLSTSISGEKMQKIVVGTLELTLSETNELTISDGVFMSDEEGLKQEGFNFTITNTGNMNAKYSIYLDDLAIDNEANRLEDKYIKYNLNQDGSSVLNKRLFHRKIYSSKLSAGASSNFILRLWLNEGIDGDISGKQFKAKLRLEVSQDLGTEPTLIKASGVTADISTGTISGLTGFRADEYRLNTSSIETKNDNEIPTTAIASWDISEAGDGKAVAYYEDDGTGSGKYRLTLGGEGGLLANSDMSLYFTNFTAETIDLTYLDTSQVTNMMGLFAYCPTLTTLDLSDFDTSNVINMSGMFSYSTLTTLDLSDFDTSNVTDMRGMFFFSTLTALDLSNFDTSKVTDMSYMFAGTDEFPQQFKSITLTNFDTSNVTNMSYMFHGCPNLTTLDLSNFNTSNVTDMSYMFYKIGLTTLDLSNFNTSSVTNMEHMFSTCFNLTSLNLSSFDTSNVTNMRFMFISIPNLTSLNLTSFDTSKVSNFGLMFKWDHKLTSIFVSDKWQVRTNANVDQMFEGCGTDHVTYV